MPATNGHGPKRAILYARVSTDEQARSGYSLAQQLEALREYAAREDYEVLEEVTDEGQSGASLARPGWELRGLLRCSCGWRMSTHTTSSSGRATDYHYYVCKQRKRRKQACGCTQRGVKALEAESAVWEFVSSLLRDPKHVRRGMERLIEQERLERARDPEHEAEVWAQKIAECDRKRGAYQDQQAAGLMTLEELGSKLRELDTTRTTAERELATLGGRRQRVEELEQDRDALLESMAEMVPEALDALTGEEKNRIYRMLRLEVTPSTEGYEVSGALCTCATPLVPARDPAPPAP